VIETANAVASAIVVSFMVGPLLIKIDRHNQTICDHAYFNSARTAGGAAEVVGETMQEPTRRYFLVLHRIVRCLHTIDL
jgi:hypothetical protein